MTPRTLATLFALSLATSAAFAPEARAQAPRAAARAPEPLGSALHGEARSEYELGRTLLRDGDAASALRKFRHAYDLQADPRLLWNIAICEKNLRHYAKVLALVDEFLAKGGDLLTREDRESAAAFTRAVRALVGDVTIQCGEQGVAIYVDDERIDQGCGSPIRMDEGTRRIRVAKVGFKEGHADVAVPGGGQISVNVALTPVEHAGRWTISAGAGDAIAIDGRAVAQDSWSGTLASGRHTIEVSTRGKKSYRAEVVVKDDDDRNLMVTLEAETSRWPFIVGGGVLLVGAAIGGYFLFRPKDPSPVYGTLGGYPPR